MTTSVIFNWGALYLSGAAQLQIMSAQRHPLSNNTTLLLFELFNLTI